MANKTWVGTDSGNEGDWATAANWLPSGVPVAADDVYFVSGSQNVTAGLNQATITLTSLNFGTKYTGSILTVLEISATTLDYANKVGTVVIEGTFPTVNIQATSNDTPALKLDSCTITSLRITGGNGTVLVDNSTTVSGAIDIIGAGSVKLEIESGATVSAADITIDDGTFLTYEEVDTVTQFGGLTEFLNSAGTTNTITMYKGKCKYKVTGATTLTTLLMYGGFFDIRGSNTPSHTITNATVYAGAMIDERNGLENTLFTNPIVMNGGVVKCDFGREVTIT